MLLYQQKDFKISEGWYNALVLVCHISYAVKKVFDTFPPAKVRQGRT